MLSRDGSSWARILNQHPLLSDQDVNHKKEMINVALNQTVNGVVG